MRFFLLALLFLAVAIAPAILPGRPQPKEHAVQAPPPIPPAAVEALKQGRYWRASRILREYLAAAPDTTPEAALLAAQAEAGWGDWSRVEALLSGQPWLDRYRGGQGWLLLGQSRLELGRFGASENALTRYLEVAADAGQRDRGLTELRRGLALLRAGDGPAAASAFRTAAGLLPQLADWIGLFDADATAVQGDTAALRQKLEAVDAELAATWAWRVRVRAQRRAGDLTGAARTAEAAANGLDAARGRARAWRQTGELRLALGDTAAARAALLRAMEAAPMVMAAVEAANLLDALPPGPADERLRVGRLYLRHGNLTRGIEALLAFLATSALPPVERAEIRLELGRAYFRAARYAEAERALLELAADAPSSAIAAEALFLAGRAQYRQGREADARATLLRTAERHPRERAAAEALFLLADFDHDDGRLESAREYYRRVADTRPELSQAGLALMRLGGMAWLAGDAARAAEIFDEYRGKQPDRQRYQQASYWAARAYQRAGADSLATERLREARRAEPLSYYGLRAAELLGEPPLGFAMEAAPAPNPAWEAEVATAVARLDLLRELGLAEEAAFEVERLKRHFAQQDGKLYALAEALNERGYTYTGILIGREMQRREGAWNPRLLRIVYPFPYRNLVLAEAEERGLDPFLLAGLIRQESMFNAQVVSPAGAIGLMQLMPRTGRMLAQSAGVRRFAADLLEHPELNLHLGAAYLAELLGRYGRRSAALAAYNAGPHRVSRWRTYPEFADDELFAERIPFAETREYLKAVQQNARLYALLYGPIPAAVRGHSGGASR